jgi:hypothetical protein
MKRIPLLSTLSCLLLALACKTAGPRVAPAAAAASDPLAAYLGELRLLRHDAEASRIQLDARSRPAEGCAVAVRVQAAAFQKGSARLVLETLGTPRVREERVACKRMQPTLELTISGFPASAGVAELTARLDAVLQTPEAYLAAKGVRFDLAPAGMPTEVASREISATSAEASLARRVTVWPLPLLAVDPWYHDRSGRVHQQSEVDLDAVVGSDGRLYKPKIKTTLSDTHASCVLRPLPLWRFTPARRTDAPVAARVALRPVLYIY